MRELPLIIVCSTLLCAGIPCVSQPDPGNLALKAKASASSEFSDQYRAALAIDGVIPGSLTQDDIGRVWAVQGATAGDRATFSLEWKEPVTIAEIDYFGRTAWLVEECWRDYEVYLDENTIPVTRGRFEFGAGPQQISLEPKPARKLTFRFLNSYGGPNPGAAEIQVYAKPTPPGFLPKFKKNGWELPEETPELVKVVREGKMGFAKLLVIQRHELNPSHVYTACCEGFIPGGGLYVLSPATPEGQLKELVASPEGEILDCDVSYDGNEILFSWRKNAEDGYHLYRVGADGKGLKQLTSGNYHDYNACYLPDGGIAFVSTRASVFALCFTTPSGVLYRMDRDGSNLRRLSANVVNDFTPSVMPDGRILYSRWEYNDRPAVPIQSLWTINPDGTDLSVFYGNRVLSPASFLEARSIPGTAKVLCTLTGHNGPIRGAVGVIDRSRGVNAQSALQNLTPSVNIGRVNQGDGNMVRGPFENPYPLNPQQFLVSGGGSIYLGDSQGRWGLVKPREGATGFYNPMPLSPKSSPPVLRSSLQAATDGTGTLFLLDIYKGLEPTVQRGSVKQIAVVQEVAKPLRTEVLGFGFQRPVISCGATYAVKKLLGYVPVEADGSACFRVPAGVPLYFMAIDEHGQAVQRMRSYTHLMPGETQGCVGCHEPRHTTPKKRNGLALRHPPRDLEPPEWGAEPFDYSRIVQPVLDRYCADCHGGAKPPKGVDLTGDKTDWFNVSYDVLTRGWVSWIDTRNGQEQNILQIAPKTWGSPASRLSKLILTGHPDEKGNPRVQMEDASRRRLFAWIDLNVPYYGTYEMDNPQAEGGRRVYPEELNTVLGEVSQRRCASCHQSGPPSRGFLRITQPERNDFLAAPLAKSAGGREACGKAVFSSKSDPDYQAMLRVFEPTRLALQARPRMDMAGAKPAQKNCSCL
ncbi:MAG: hypothetical protein HY318_05495 [Armatimonadetes bacterium]|nr:hypothetical protein [Armatimonadota bacterium]